MNDAQVALRLAEIRDRISALSYRNMTKITNVKGLPIAAFASPDHPTVIGWLASADISAGMLCYLPAGYGAIPNSSYNGVDEGYYFMFNTDSWLSPYEADFIIEITRACVSAGVKIEIGIHPDQDS